MAEAEITKYERQWQEKIEQLTPAFTALGKPWQIALVCTLIETDFAEYADALGFDDEMWEMFYTEGLRDVAEAPELRARLGLPADATTEAVEVALTGFFRDQLVRPDLKHEWLVTLIQDEE